MRTSFFLGSVSGIKVHVHFSFFLIYVYFALAGHYQHHFPPSKILFQCLLITGAYFCVLLHEFGHALAARRYGIGTRQIVLLPIGGVAQLEGMPRRPNHELVVALAGPMVNLIIAAILLTVNLFYYPMESVLSITPEMNYTLALMWANIVLFIFNLAPAFPMDGGRVLRATLAYMLPYVKATRIAARIGQTLAIGALVAAFWFEHYIWILLGVFIIAGAEMEYRMVARKVKLEGLVVKDALLQRYTTLCPTDTLEHAMSKAESGNEKEFVVADEEMVLGVLTHENMMDALREHGRAAMVGSIMETDLPRIRTDHSIEYALDMMEQYQLHLLPVLDGTHWVGVIHQNNIHKLMNLNTGRMMA